MSVELALGIIGTISGLCSLYLHYKRMQKEKPILSIEVLDCRHKVSKDGKLTFLFVKYIVKNIGDRGTRLNKIEASVVDWQGMTHEASCTIPKDSHVDGNDNKTFFHLIHFSPLFQYSVKMKCRFNLHTTHEILTFEHDSSESKDSLESEQICFL
jgi:hypothetical protein